MTNYNIMKFTKPMFFDEKMDGTLTLKKKKPNRIKKIDDTGIIVQTEKGEDEISIKKLEEA